MLGYYYGNKGQISQSETMQMNHVRYTDETRVDSAGHPAPYHSHMTNIHMPTTLQLVHLFDKYNIDLQLYFTAVKT
jgi:beta-lactamase class A